MELSAHLLIIAGTFSEEMITTGMSFNEDDTCTPKMRSKRSKFYSTSPSSVDHTVMPGM